MSSWIQVRSPRPRARVRLVCLAHAGGSAQAFDAWGRDIHPDIEVWAVQLPGRQNRLRETPLTDMAAVIPPLASAVAERAGGEPIAIFGHCLGALAGFELAREWRRRGLGTPVHLFASSYSGPDVPRTERPIRDLSDADFVRRIRDLRGTPTDALDSPELVALLLPSLRGDFSILETYACTPGEPLACPITVLAGESDPHINARGLRAWKAHTRAEFALELLPGSHFFFQNSRPLLTRIAKRLLETPAPSSCEVSSGPAAARRPVAE